MTKEIEWNKLIAAFMSESSEPYSENGDFVSYNGVDADAVFVDFREMKYHTSYDWLMSVVEKIRYEEGLISTQATIDYLFGRSVKGLIFKSIRDLWEVVIENIEYRTSLTQKPTP